MNQDFCIQCKPLIDCIVPCVIGLIGGIFQVLRSHNYSLRAFAMGTISAFLASLIFCLLTKDMVYFVDKQNTMLALSGLIGVSSLWIFDVALPRLRRMILNKAEKEIEK